MLGDRRDCLYDTAWFWEFPNGVDMLCISSKQIQSLGKCISSRVHQHISISCVRIIHSSSELDTRAIYLVSTVLRTVFTSISRKFARSKRCYLRLTYGNRDLFVSFFQRHSCSVVFWFGNIYILLPTNIPVSDQFSFSLPLFLSAP